MLPHLRNSGVDLDSEAQLARVMYQFEAAQIIIRDGNEIGLLKLDRSSNPWELIQIQIIPSLQGQGLGAVLIERVLAEALEAGVGVGLSVLKANPAKRLYEKLGFSLVSESEFEYSMRFVS